MHELRTSGSAGGGISNEGGAEGACRRHAFEEKKQKKLMLFQEEIYGFR